MYCGLFSYDLTEWKDEDPADFAANVEPFYDGWSIGCVMYFEYYKFEDDSQSFGACLANGRCFGVWLVFNSAEQKYSAKQISFTHQGTVNATEPSVPAGFDQAFVTDDYGFYSYDFYEADRAWEFLDSRGQAFWYMLRTDDPNRWQVGDETDIWTFSSLA